MHMDTNKYLEQVLSDQILGDWCVNIITWMPLLGMHSVIFL